MHSFPVVFCLVSEHLCGDVVRMYNVSFVKLH